MFLCINCINGSTGWFYPTEILPGMIAFAGAEKIKETCQKI